MWCQVERRSRGGGEVNGDGVELSAGGDCGDPGLAPGGAPGIAAGGMIWMRRWRY